MLAGNTSTEKFSPQHGCSDPNAGFLQLPVALTGSVKTSTQNPGERNHGCEVILILNRGIQAKNTQRLGLSKTPKKLTLKCFWVFSAECCNKILYYSLGQVLQDRLLRYWASWRQRRRVIYKCKTLAHRAVKASPPHGKITMVWMEESQYLLLQYFPPIKSLRYSSKSNRDSCRHPSCLSGSHYQMHRAETNNFFSLALYKACSQVCKKNLHVFKSSNVINCWWQHHKKEKIP